jgi:hypothetical protein
MDTNTSHHLLTIVGPLGDGTFHVHDARCADLAKAKYRGFLRDWSGRYLDQADVVCDIYADFIEDDSEWESYAGDVQFFPCAGVAR